MLSGRSAASIGREAALKLPTCRRATATQNSSTPATPGHAKNVNIAQDAGSSRYARTADAAAFSADSVPEPTSAGNTAIPINTENQSANRVPEFCLGNNRIIRAAPSAISVPTAKHSTKYSEEN